MLVVSNNPFSRTTNNGKTLASFFSGFSAGNVAQLYFSEEKPVGGITTCFFSISDRAILRSLVSGKHACGERVTLGSALSETRERRKDVPGIVDKVKHHEMARILREIMWSFHTWNTRLLCNWLDEFSPEMIFFCAGDSGFAYDIVAHIQKNYDCGLAVYVTDDYVLPRRTVSPTWWLRRGYVLKRMREAVERSDVFLTISPEMREAYRSLFGKDSIVIMNASESLRVHGQEPDGDTLTLTYAGGLHFNRHKTLRLLADSIKKYNEHSCKSKAILRIYSVQKLKQSTVDYLTVHGASQFCGALDEQELKVVLNRSDILVHVESFDRRCVESTRLSISTKIPEYLSVGKPILAIGPSVVASVNYLRDAALCVTDPGDISPGVAALLSDRGLRARLAHKALMKYENFHRKEVVLRGLKDALIKASAARLRSHSRTQSDKSSF